MNSLFFKDALRKGSANKIERQYLDFIISGQSLRKILNIEDADFITPFGWSDNREYTNHYLNLFRLKEKSELETGRTIFYTCLECADIGCGAITALILDHGSKIIWKDFGYETDYSGVTEEYYIAPIEFDRQVYFKALNTLI